MNYQFIYDEFELYYPLFAKRMVKWEASDLLEIAIYLDDGSTMLYDFITKVITLRVIYEDEEVSKEKWIKEFSYNLHRRILNSGLSQEELADMIGVSQGSISNYTSGRQLPSIYITMCLANVLGCDINDLIQIKRFPRDWR